MLDFNPHKRPMPTPSEIMLGAEIPVLDHGYVRYVTHMGNDLSPLEAARMSTGNPTGVDETKDAATRDFLWRHAHATPFEMAVLQVEVQVPLFVAREWMRHRTQSFNEHSGRYAEMPALYYQPHPERVQGQSETNKQGSGSELSERTKDYFLESLQMDQKLLRGHYEEFLEEGVSRELARINLPLSQYTRFRAQANLRNWLHFLNLRMAPNAQYEIRVYAHALAGLIQELWPETWKVFEEHTLEGATLSRTERKLVTDLLRSYLETIYGTVTDEQMAKYISEHPLNTLNKSKTREFLTKLDLA